jgi:hypothetical protein
LCSLINYFNYGKHYKIKIVLTIKFADIDPKIIPFFFKYPFLVNKILNFQDFCPAARAEVKLVKEKKHLQIKDKKQTNNYYRAIETTETKIS